MPPELLLGGRPALERRWADVCGSRLGWGRGVCEDENTFVRMEAKAERDEPHLYLLCLKSPRTLSHACLVVKESLNCTLMMAVLFPVCIFSGKVKKRLSPKTSGITPTCSKCVLFLGVGIPQNSPAPPSPPQRFLSCVPIVYVCLFYNEYMVY